MNRIKSLDNSIFLLLILEYIGQCKKGDENFHFSFLGFLNLINLNLIN
jgi:hypothetical protein